MCNKVNLVTPILITDNEYSSRIKQIDQNVHLNKVIMKNTDVLITLAANNQDVCVTHFTNNKIQHRNTVDTF